MFSVAQILRERIIIVLFLMTINQKFLTLQTEGFMPEISSFYGIIISMFFSDHNPPHFHVKYQGFEATIDIATGTIKEESLEKWTRSFYILQMLSICRTTF